MENEKITYSVDIDGKQPVIITAKIRLADGEIITHKRNIGFAEAEAIALAYINAQAAQSEI